MIAALILAAAAVGQSRIDIDYSPRAGDKALLGKWSVGSPDDTIERAACYSSLEDVKAAIEASIEEVADGGLSQKPDGYALRAGTAVSVTAVLTVGAEMGGLTIKRSVLKVRVLEGAFKGRELLTTVYSVFRYKRKGDS
jgi:hypothetical protein